MCRDEITLSRLKEQKKEIKDLLVKARKNSSKKVAQDKDFGSSTESLLSSSDQHSNSNYEIQ